jgi:hypothetical protein
LRYIVTSYEYWIHVGGEKNVGIVKLDMGSHSNIVIETVILSEAQYLGTEVKVDVLGYPLYNIMLVERNRIESGQLFVKRIGVGKIYKYAWEQAAPKRATVVVE